MKFIRVIILMVLCSVNMIQAEEIDVEGFVSINNTSLFYRCIGEGEPILILHGGPGFDQSYFLPQMKNLSAKYKLIFFDMRGCGKSSMKVDSGSISVDQFVEDIESLREYFKLGKMNLMGHSFGGLVAMRYAIKYPDKLKSLLLINSSPASSSWRDSSFALIAARKDPDTESKIAALKKTQAFKNQVPDTMAYFYKLVFRTSFFNPERVSELNLNFQSNYQESTKLMNQLFKDTTLVNYDLNPELRKLKVPTLIIGTETDVIPPLSVEDLHNNIKGSHYIFLEGCGHFPFIEQPEQFLKAIEKFFSKI